MLTERISGWVVTWYVMALSVGMLPNDAVAACCDAGNGDRCCGQCCSAGPDSCSASPCS